MKQNEVLVAEMQTMRKEKSLRAVDHCKLKNKTEWDQWQGNKGVKN